MGDVGDTFRALRDYRTAIRWAWGIKCPKCIEEQPRRQPTVLLPGQRCRVHKPPYVDQRERLTNNQIDAANEQFNRALPARRQTFNPELATASNTTPPTKVPE